MTCKIRVQNKNMFKVDDMTIKLDREANYFACNILFDIHAFFLVRIVICFTLCFLEYTIKYPNSMVRSSVQKCLNLKI